VWTDPEIVALGEQAHAANAARIHLALLVGIVEMSFPLEHVRDLYAQFSALDRITQLLVENMRAEAS
jgi:hypothetical protein